MTKGKTGAIYKKEDLIYLVYCANTAYITLRENPPKGVTVDPEKGTWTFTGPFGSGTRPIGTSFRFRAGCPVVYEGYPVGVYDRTKIEHLNAALYQVREVEMEFNVYDD